MSGLLARLPPGFWVVRYVGARYPGSQAVVEHPGIADGANCQLFAYEVLRYFGLEVPELRSSELWADTAATTSVSDARPLDLVLFNATRDPWGAHVGVWTDDDQVLHLCSEVGRPVVWRMDEFAARDRYRTVIGIKRVIRQVRPA
ncbi:hydrolase [Actinomadura mexicana]|uniref:hydrolase n=1 Tax=Actinomadura mexicana TaxID=134959 RepID=UPI000B76F071|nr:hydrolase [Actinomadura mexicana]